MSAESPPVPRVSGTEVITGMIQCVSGATNPCYARTRSFFLEWGQQRWGWD